MSQRRFRIALSFPGEHRDYVREVAERVGDALGREVVFYDEWYEAELARPNFDTYLQAIYRDQADVVVVFLGADYQRKRWCRLEWRAVRDLIADLADDRIVMVRFDDAPVDGVFSIDGYIDARKRGSGQLGALLVQRLEGVGHAEPPRHTRRRALLAAAGAALLVVAAVVAIPRLLSDDSGGSGDSGDSGGSAGSTGSAALGETDPAASLSGRLPDPRRRESGAPTSDVRDGRDASPAPVDASTAGGRERAGRQDPVAPGGPARSGGRRGRPNRPGTATAVDAGPADVVAELESRLARVERMLGEARRQYREQCGAMDPGNSTAQQRQECANRYLPRIGSYTDEKARLEIELAGHGVDRPARGDQ